MKNKTGRNLLEQRYGKGCFMERAGIREITEDEEQENIRTIKGYKKLNREITYHHIFEKQYGGKVSIENGANLASYNHEWLHEQTPEVKEKINRQLQEFKRQLDVTQIKVTDKGLDIQKPSRLEFDMSDCIEIPLYENIKESSPKHSFNRAKVKRETMKMIEEELYR